MQHVPISRQKLVDRYGTLEGKWPGTQANHMNQNAAFKEDDNGKVYIKERDGIAVVLSGNSTDKGTSHNKFHVELESFWTPYRDKTSPKYKQRPTNDEYDKALRAALSDAGFTPAEVQKLGDQAEVQRNDAGLTPNKKVPRVPDPTPT